MYHDPLRFFLRSYDLFLPVTKDIQANHLGSYQSDFGTCSLGNFGLIICPTSGHRGSFCVDQYDFSLLAYLLAKYSRIFRVPGDIVSSDLDQTSFGVRTWLCGIFGPTYVIQKPFARENGPNGHRSHFGSRYHIWSMRLARPFCHHPDPSLDSGPQLEFRFVWSEQLRSGLGFEPRVRRFFISLILRDVAFQRAI